MSKFNFTTNPPFFIGQTIGLSTSGSVLFGGTSGILSQDNANFFWDSTNHRLLLGATNPANSQILIGPGALGVGRAGIEINKTFTNFTANNFSISNSVTANQVANTTNNLVGIQNFVQTTAANTHTLNSLIGEYFSITNVQNVGVVSSLTGIQMSVTNASTLVGNNITGIQLSVESDPVAGTLGTLAGLIIGATSQGAVTNLYNIQIESPFSSPGIVNAHGIFIDDQSTIGGTNSFGIKINTQSANATTTRAIELIGTGVSNSIRFGSSANVFSNSANNIRITDSTNVSGIDFDLTTTIPSINTTLTNGAIYLAIQNKTFTSGATNEAVRIIPTWTAENFTHRTIFTNPTQQGSNTQTLIGYSVLIAQTGAGTLGNAQAIEVQTPSAVGTLTVSTGIQINNQSLAGGTNSTALIIAPQTANATTTRAISLQGTGLSNAIVWGNSALQYANAADNIRITNNSNTGGIDFNLTTTSATINTVTQNSASLILQNQTFTPGGTHNSVQISPTWSTATEQNAALSIMPTQNGANAQNLSGIDFTMTKATGASTLTTMAALLFETPVITGTVTNSHCLRIRDQTNASATTTRSIFWQATGLANSLAWSSSVILYSSANDNFRIANNANGGGIDFNVTNAGPQTITTVTGNLSLTSTTGITAVTSSRFNTAQGANIASANDISLGTDGNFFLITGTTTVNTIASTNWQAGSIIILKFSGALTVAHNTAGTGAVIFLASSSNLTTANNTILGLIYDGTQWQETFRKAA